MYQSFKFLPVITFLLFAGCYQKHHSVRHEDGLASFNADSLKKHISVLASDSFCGRKPFTSGETKTINYLQQQFIIAGLEPGNDNSYLQEVPMVNILAIAQPSMQIESPKGNFTLKSYDDYIIWTDNTDGLITLDTSELVFVGYGVVAPEYNWNDYEGLNVKGKIVLVMINDPGFWVGDTSLFKGKAMTYYGRWTYKFEEAAKQGAKGCLIIHNDAAAGYPFIVQQNKFNSSRLQLENRNKEIKNCDVIGWLPETVANKLFIAAGYDSSLFVQANKRNFKAIPLNIRMSTTMSVQATYNKSYNVVGKIIGSKHPDEVIIYTAHWDHLGIGRPDEKGDSIYNGALDNASGTAGLLELARAFNSLETKPERTIIFLSVTAEEQGLLGSEYYTQNPIYPLDKTVANINIECLSWFSRTKDIVIVGKGQSKLEDYLEEEIKKEGGYVTFETHPETGSYYRSDHFSFAKAGVPALYAVSGIDVVGKGREFGKKMQDEYREKNYHRPSDEFDSSTWTMDGGINDLKLLFQVGKRLAFDEKWVQWKSGSEFKKIREKMR
jgi:Zn-dependent M28 family amino/carboxypeptidase